jgi:hypothetical protein
MSRRAFLAAGGSAAVLAACGKGTSSAPTTTAASGTNSTPASTGAATVNLVTFADTSALLPQADQRVTFGVADKDGVVLRDAPASLDFTVFFNGQPLGAPIKAELHRQGIPRPYFPVIFSPPGEGVFSFQTTVNGSPAEATIQIPPATTVTSPGQPMPALDTPTVADQRGVQLLCTRSPACPLHDITLREALAAGTPVAFIVATPAFCQTAICGPVLDVLLGQKDAFPQVKMLHAEVYPTEAAAAPGVQELTDTVKAFGLTFEPVLYLVKPGGTIVKRIDTIFDGVELHDALSQLVA